MNVLAIDTCFSACSVAAGRAVGNEWAADTVVYEHDMAEIGHAEMLMPMIERSMAAAALRFPDLERIIVTRGPGTFTGVRTGIAVARALALATPARLIGVSSLWAVGIAALARQHSGIPSPSGNGVLVAMDARKSMVYAQIIDGAGLESGEPSLVDPATAAKAAQTRGLLVVGTGARSIAEAGQERGFRIALDAAGESSAALQVPNAVHLIAAAQREPCQDPLQPLYLRPPDAKPQAGKALPWSPT